MRRQNFAGKLHQYCYNITDYVKHIFSCTPQSIFPPKKIQIPKIKERVCGILLPSVYGPTVKNLYWLLIPILSWLLHVCIEKNEKKTRWHRNMWRRSILKKDSRKETIMRHLANFSQQGCLVCQKIKTTYYLWWKGIWRKKEGFLNQPGSELIFVTVFVKLTTIINRPNKLKIFRGHLGNRQKLQGIVHCPEILGQNIIDPILLGIFANFRTRKSESFCSKQICFAVCQSVWGRWYNGKDIRLQYLPKEV